MAKTRKILMIVENVPAPKDRRVWPEAITLRDYGFQVSIISPKGVSECRESYACVDGIHLYRYKIPAIGHKYIGYAAEYGVALLMTFWLSMRVLFRHGFDVIHTANPLLEWCSYKTAHLVIVTNVSQKRFAIERGHCRAGRVFVVRNGPDLWQWELAVPQPELKGGRPYLLGYVGFMGVQDGVEYALYALHDLVHKRGRQDMSLVLMGEGASAPALRILAMEYMAMGKPIVAFDLAETRFSAQDAALYIVEDFANKIEVLLADEAFRLRMGTVGRRRVEEILSWGRTKIDLLLAYEMLFAKSSALSGLPGSEILFVYRRSLVMLTGAYHGVITRRHEKEFYPLATK